MSSAQLSIEDWPRDGPKSFAVNRTVDPRKLESHPIKISVPADAYRYIVNLTSGSTLESRRGCMVNRYTAVLPGDDRRVKEVLDDGVVETLSAQLVAGFKPANVSVALAISRAVLQCGTTPQVEPGGWVWTEQSRIGYYGESDETRKRGITDTARSYSDPDPRTMLTITLPDQTLRYIPVRLGPPGPFFNWGGPPPYLRFDLTDSVVEAAKRRPPNTVVCL
jgi:hypothetical protein